MSRSKADRPLSFDAWVTAELARSGPFTALVVVLAIGELSVTPLRSSWFHVIGGELAWSEVARLLDSCGADWDGALFATRRARGGGPLPDAAVRLALRELGDRVVENRAVLNEEHFFDRRGRRMQVEEVPAQ